MAALDHEPVEQMSLEAPVHVSRPLPEDALPPTISEGRTHPMRTRLHSGICKQNPRYTLVTRTDIPTVPKIVASALKHPCWNGAMGYDMSAQQENGTMSMVPRRPDMNVLECRWIFIIKWNVDGTVRQLKARLVAKGYDQEEGVDFVETYSLVVITSTIRWFSALQWQKDGRFVSWMLKTHFCRGNCRRKCSSSNLLAL